jgi:hypothetical protein
MKRLIGCMVAGLGLGMVIMACGGSDSATGPGGGGTLTDAEVIGKWTATSAHKKGWETDSAGNKINVDSVLTDAADLPSIEYKSDKTVTTDLGGFALTGTWKIKGDSVITINSFFGIADTSSAYVVINGKSGTYTTHQVDSEQDVTITTSATKQ